MNQKKQDMLDALERTLGVVAPACKQVGISRWTHYDWKKSDEEYNKGCQAIDEASIDFAESNLYKLIKNGNPSANIFYLKTKGKKRGYIETQHLEIREKKPLSWFDEVLDKTDQTESALLDE
tara:strand:- start:2021 stop:2386 length:366 start_codon:yes stop_codon:yes gene_type:complete